MERKTAVTPEIIARAWTDEKFKAKLLSDPAATLAAEGVELPENVQLKMHEDSSTARHLVLPQPPELHDLKASDLMVMAARKLEAQLLLF